MAKYLRMVDAGASMAGERPFFLDARPQMADAPPFIPIAPP
jgi:hypothetical protein